MSNDNANVNALLAFVLGATLGCLGGLLVAPTSGRKLRRQIKKRGRKLQYAASDLKDRGGEAVERLGERIADKADAVTERARSAVGR